MPLTFIDFVFSPNSGSAALATLAPVSTNRYDMAKSAKRAKKGAKKAKTTKPVRVSYHRRPEDMQLDLWQLGLRKQFGEENDFHVTNTGPEPVFSEFIVWNPSTRNSYAVALRSGLPKKGLPPENTMTRIGNACTCQDFKTNRLGLCKHISATLHQVRKKYGAKKALAAGARPPYSLIYVDYRQGPRIRLYVGVQQEAELLKWALKWFDPNGYLSESGFQRFETVLKEARRIQPEFKCNDDAFDVIAEQRERRRRQAHLENTLPQGPGSPYFDQLLKVKLFPYQKRGVWFAANAGRCLLADEMEIEKFSDATVHVVEGLQNKRLKQYEKTEAFYNIVSYNTVASDADYLQILGADLLIIDEAQRIKNFRTKVSIQLKKVRTPYCFVLTGTPLENKLEDLYAVTQFVDQYKLPPLYRFLDRYQILGDNGQVRGYKNLKEIGEILSDCLIRRLKKEVLRDLPKRLDKALFVPMTREQKDIHRDLADHVARLVAKWRRFHFLNETDRRILILCLSQMRMVADSTFILDQQTRFDTKIAELMYILEEALADPEQKVVVFSQWERMTRLVAQELDALDTGYAYLHGGIPSADRAGLLTRFREDPACRVFLSTDAGGVGLNLQSASLLVNLDIPWNPAVLEQRVGRIHRMGQTENVTVVNMVSAESIEQRMLGVLEFKSSMAQGVLDPDGDDTIFMSESKFKKFMENVETLTGEGWQAPPADLTDAAPDDAGSEDFELPPSSSAPEPDTLHPRADTFPGDDDTPAEAPTTASPQTAATRETQPAGPDEARERSASTAGARPAAAAPATPQELVQTGVSFFSGLAQTLSSPEKTQELVQSIVATDAETGQTYLKIPVESAAVVENAVRLLGGLLAGLGRG
ncbi:MAG: SNF2-related protein [Thermoanaerobaculia bacterium]|nr:SNF2-related protein [Thermoanaerobaculia bacterium]